MTIWRDRRTYIGILIGIALVASIWATINFNEVIASPLQIDTGAPDDYWETPDVPNPDGRDCSILVYRADHDLAMLWCGVNIPPAP